MKITLAIGLLCIALSAHAQREMKVTNDDHPVYEIERTSHSEGFWNIFLDTASTRAPLMFESRLHPLYNLKKLVRFEGDHRAYLEAVDDEILRAFSKTLSYSAREASLELSISEWIRDGEGFFPRFFRGSIGSTEEEEIRSGDTSYLLTEEHWWGLLRDKGLRYGVRPFSSNPYAYVGFHVGPHQEPYALFDLRYRISHFKDPEIELAVSVPIPSYATLDIGTSYRFEKESEPVGFTTRLYRKVNDHLLVFFAADIREEREFFIGLTLTH